MPRSDVARTTAIARLRGWRPIGCCRWDLDVEPRRVPERLTRMRAGRILPIALALSFLAGCGDDQGLGATRDQSEIRGEVHLGPQCPVETVGVPCPDGPAAGAMVTVSRQLPGDSYAGGEVVARTMTDVDGGYRIAVEPGEYVVTADAGLSCEVMDVRVSAETYSNVDIPCDTGIR